MIETWFISDTHFGHANILKYEPTHRPFNNLIEMHEALINRWNNVVGKNDKVYHLGDVCFGLANLGLLKFLNGDKRLVLGNHDGYPIHNYQKYFTKISGVRFWYNYILTHVPVHPLNLEGRSDFNIHGHLHSKRVLLPDSLEPDKRYINVSVEQNNLTPINAQVILDANK